MDVDDLEEELPAIEFRVGYLSGRLIEILRQRDEEHATFIHSSVKKFLLADGLEGLKKLLDSSMKPRAAPPEADASALAISHAAKSSPSTTTWHSETDAAPPPVDKRPDKTATTPPAVKREQSRKESRLWYSIRLTSLLVLSHCRQIPGHVRELWSTDPQSDVSTSPRRPGKYSMPVASFAPFANIYTVVITERDGLTIEAIARYVEVPKWVKTAGFLHSRQAIRWAVLNKVDIIALNASFGKPNAMINDAIREDVTLPARMSTRDPYSHSCIETPASSLPGCEVRADTAREQTQREPRRKRQHRRGDSG